MDHLITICTSCRHKGTDHRPGFELMERVRQAFAQGRAETGAATFDVTGVACMAGCERPCAVAFQAPQKATYLFGDIDPATDVDDLVRFAELYSALDDGWCSSLDRPGKLRQTTLARIPAAMMAPPASLTRAS